MTPLFVFAADAHLSKLIWRGRPDLVDDAYRGFGGVIDVALHNQVPLLLGGDLFDKSRPESESVQVAYDQLERMRVANLPVYYNQGQHDMSDPPWLSVHPWPIHAHRKPFTVAGYSFYGLDWQPAGLLQTELAQIPVNTMFLLAHQVWKEHMGGIGNPEGSVSEVPHARFLLTGDYHQRQVTEWPNAAGEKMFVVSPGSTHMRAIDEPPVKSCELFMLDQQEKLTIQQICIPSRPYHEIRITNEGELLKFCQEAAVNLQTIATPADKLLLRVIYPMEIPEVSARIRQAVGDRTHLFESPYSSNDVVNLAEATTTSQSQRTSVESAIDRAAESPALALAAKQLWSAPDVGATLTEMFERFI